MKQVTLLLTPKEACDSQIYVAMAAKQVGVEVSRVALARVLKRSIDARSRLPKVNLTLEIYIDTEQTPVVLHFEYGDVTTRPEVIIVGSGPAGLFAALRLIETGYRPTILERGKDVSARKKDIATINRGGQVDPNSNYAFGEGGAGTFSDGKLYTRSKKRGDYNRVLQTLVFHGASEEILYNAHPHIGSDKLPRIMTAIRKTITDCGGRFLFDSRVTALTIKDGKLKGVECGDQKVEGIAVVLATGHSARDIYEMLHQNGIAIEAKPFAMGLRVEHSQHLIDKIQYHTTDRGEYLPAATYSLVSQVAGRGVYSFCMCPGGVIVPAMTSGSECVVNSMSASGRNSPFANSAIVTEVRLSDFAHLRADHGELAGLRFQQQFEMAARAAGGDRQVAPAQRACDFMAGKLSTSTPKTSYIPGVTSSQMGDWMPQFISQSIRGGLSSFDTKMRGFLTNDALLVGVESRTSTPVRIPRDPETLAHPQFSNLYPAGEGAGYAGGIVSAALDGIRIADAIAVKF